MADKVNTPRTSRSGNGITIQRPKVDNAYNTGAFNVYKHFDSDSVNLHAPKDMPTTASLFWTGLAPDKEQRKYLMERFRTRKAARMRAGVPEDLADQYMSYAPSKVSHWTTPDGKVYRNNTPKYPSFRTFVKPAKGRTPNYQVTEGTRMYAPQGSEFGNINPNVSHNTLGEEGAYAWGGHFGTQPYQGEVSTSAPIITGNPVINGLSPYAMNPYFLGGDLGSRISEYRKLLKDKTKGPKAAVEGSDGPRKGQVGYLASRLIQNKHNGLYGNSPVEFASAAEQLKTLAALNKINLNKFDPNNPDKFVNTVGQLYAKHRVNNGVDVFRIFQRYRVLHNKMKSKGVKSLTPTERTEYLHMRKSLPGIWDQASVHRTDHNKDKFIV